MANPPVLRLVEHGYRGMENVEVGALTLFKVIDPEDPLQRIQWHTGIPFIDAKGIHRAEIGGRYDASWRVLALMYIDTLVSFGSMATEVVSILQTTPIVRTARKPVVKPLAYTYTKTRTG